MKTTSWIHKRYTYTIQSNYLTRTTLSFHQTKLAKKTQQINVFNTLHSSVLDLKSVIALSSKGGVKFLVTSFNTTPPQEYIQMIGHELQRGS